MALRLAIGPILLLAAFAVFTLRLYHLQVVEHESWKDRAERQRTKVVLTPAARGSIWDAKGRLVAGVNPVLVVTAVPRQTLPSREAPKQKEKLPEHNRRLKALARASEILQVPADKIRRQLDSDDLLDAQVPIAINVTVRQAAQISAEQFGLLEGYAVGSQPMRMMERPGGFAHVRGWVHKPTDKDVKRLRAADSDLPIPPFAGRNGIEAAYDMMLLGRQGRVTLAVDINRKPIRELERVPSVAGKGLVLSLDQEYQAYVEDMLRRVGNGVNAFAAIDPRNGSVLSLAASPSYNLKLFEGGISTEQFALLNQDAQRPMFQRAIAGAWSPGSTFKVVTAIAAAEASKFNPNRSIYCNGGYPIGRTIKKCDNHPGGMSLNFRSAMAYSCNTYFMTLAREMGPDAMRKTSLSLGLGQRLGLDVMGEGKGLIKTKAWVSENGENWMVGNTLHFGIGQDAVTTTPLQMAQMAALIANKGVAYRPHVVRSLVETDLERSLTPIQPEIAIDKRSLGSFWRIEQEAMEAVTRFGTASGAGTPIAGGWAGKTGSTQDSRFTKPHAWFIGYAPLENPRIAFAIVMEGAGHGGAVAAPVASQLVRRWSEFSSRPESADASSLAAFLKSSASVSRLAMR